MVPKEGRVNVIEGLLKNSDTFISKKYCLAQDIAAIDDADVTLADITECDFDGYARVENPTIIDSGLNGDNRGFILTDKLDYVAGAGIASPQTIVGVYLLIDYDHTDRLVWFQRITPTVTLANPDELYETAVRMLTDDLGI